MVVTVREYQVEELITKAWQGRRILIKKERKKDKNLRVWKLKMIFEHVGITVSDLDRSIDFYTKVFGFNLLRKTDTNAYLHLGNDILEIMQCPSRCEVEKPQKSEDGIGMITSSIGLSHIGFRVDDLDETIDRLSKSGADLIVPPFEFEPKIEYTADLKEEKLIRAMKPPAGRTYWRIAMFSDPDGIILELLER